MASIKHETSRVARSGQKNKTNSTPQVKEPTFLALGLISIPHSFAAAKKFHHSRNLLLLRLSKIWFRSISPCVDQMHPQHHQDSSFDPDPQLPSIKIHHPASPRHPSASAATPTPTAGARRKIGVAVDLSDESAYAVRWAVHHYIRPGDAVILLHVSPTSVLFGADWGSIDLSISSTEVVDEDGTATPTTTATKASEQKLEDDFDAFTASKAADLARPLREAQIPYKIHIVKDHDMRERLCLEIERLGLNAVIMGSRGFGAARRGSDGKLGSVSDYCVRHCVCPVVVVRYPDDGDGGVQAVVDAKEEDGEEEKNDQKDV